MENKIYQQIANFYDNSSQLWETIWGEHMHHGYYGKSGNYKINRRQAQINLIEELLSYGQVIEANNILDVGCGIGGTSLYLAGKFNCQVTGITLSPRQVSRGKERAKNANLSNKAHFLRANALEMPFEDQTFDLVWTLESGEHMPDKKKFIQECYRVLKPGGKLIMATWCHRSTNSFAGELTDDEKKHLAKIYQVYCLPYVISIPEYEDIIDSCGFQDIKTDDWSIAVAPFWDVVIDSAWTLEAITGLLKSGWQTIIGALALPLMSSGYQRGLVRFGVMYASK
jgi:tocopherol O-methyltransferase